MCTEGRSLQLAILDVPRCNATDLIFRIDGSKKTIARQVIGQHHINLYVHSLPAIGRGPLE
eukprot:6481033-Amphidinium_carterae.1